MKHPYSQGVRWYSKGRVTLAVYFPEDQVKCSECRQFCRYAEAYKRYTCLALPSQNESLKPFAGILPNCPIVFEETNKEEVE